MTTKPTKTSPEAELTLAHNVIDALASELKRQLGKPILRVKLPADQLPNGETELRGLILVPSNRTEVL